MVASPSAAMPSRRSTARTVRQQDRQVEAHGPSVDVLHVEGEPFVPADGVAAADLSEPGKAGPHLVPAGLRGRVAREVRHQQRPRPHQGHVAAQHVEQGRQLVEARGAEEPARAGQPRGVVDVARADVDGPHGPELEDRERLAVEARAPLPEQHRPAEPDGHRHRDRRLDRRGGDQRRAGHRQVQDPLGPSSPPRLPASSQRPVTAAPRAAPRRRGRCRRPRSAEPLGQHDATVEQPLRQHR